MAKIWKFDMESKAAVAVSAEYSMLRGDKTHYVKTTPRGTVIYGPMSVVAGAESNKEALVFSGLPNTSQMIPSNTAVPMPQNVPIPPVHVGFDLASDVSYFAMLLT